MSTRSGRGQGLRVSGGEEPGHDAGVTERRRGTRIEHGRSLATTGRWSGDEPPGPAGVGSATKVELDDLLGLPSNGRGRHGQLPAQIQGGRTERQRGEQGDWAGEARPGARYHTGRRRRLLQVLAGRPGERSDLVECRRRRKGEVGHCSALMANRLLTFWGCRALPWWPSSFAVVVLLRCALASLCWAVPLLPALLPNRLRAFRGQLGFRAFRVARALWVYQVLVSDRDRSSETPCEIPESGPL